MKRSKLLFTSILATILSVGVFGVILSSRNSKPVEKVEANTHTYNPTIYFMPHNQWIQDGNERFQMKFWDSDTYKGDIELEYWGTSTVKGEFYNRKVYKGTVSNNSWVNKIQICRMGPSWTQYNYSGVFNLNEDNSAPVVRCTENLNYWNEWTPSTNGVDLLGYTEHAVYKTTDQSPSSSTGRVFFYNSGTHWASAAGCAVYAWGGSASGQKIWSSKSTTVDGSIYHLSWFTDDNGESYGYADIPTNITGYKFATINSGVNAYETTTGYFSDTVFIADSFAYVRYGLQNGNAINTGGAKNNVAGANLMKKVIQAYNTCNSSVLNGYGAYSALNNSFYSHATAAAKSATEKSLSGQTASIQTHFEGMASRSGGGSGSSAFVLLNTVQMTNSTIIPIVIVGVAVIAIGGYFLLRKKKEN